MIEKVEKLIKALLCKIEAYVAKVESIEDCCNGIDRNYVNKDGDSMQGLLELEAGVDFNDLDSGYSGHLDTEDLDEDVVWVFPNSSGTIALTSDLFSCADLTGCPEIVEIINTIPTDISDLSDNEELLFSGDYNDLDNKPTIPTDVSELTDDSNLFFDGDYNSLDNLPNIPTNNSELVNDSGYLACEDLENCQEIIDIKDSVNHLYEKFDWALDFLDQQVLDTFSPFDDWQIDSVMNVNGTPATNIEVNGSPYVLGTPIYVGQSFKITVSIPSVILLKCTQI